MLLKKILHKTEQVLAKHYLRLFPSLTIVGITGSVGKTTTKEAMAVVLAQKYRVVKTQANIDPIYNLPRTMLKVRPQTQVLVLEMGVEYPGEMETYLSWVKPKIGVVIQIAWTHTEFFGDINGVVKEKGKLIEALPPNGWQVLNWDDERTRNLSKRSETKTFFFGMDKENCDLVAEKIETSKNGLTFLLSRTINNEKIKVSWSILGQHNVYCALAAASVGVIMGLSLEEIKDGLEKLRPQPSRLNVMAGPSGSTIIDDSYNASPAGVIGALATLAEYPGRRKIAVLGEMKELGSYSEKGHRQVGEALVSKGIDYLIVFGQLTSSIVGAALEKGMDKRHIFETKTMKEITMILKKLLEEDDVILLKGSRFSHMERVILGLKGMEIACDLTTCKKYAPCALCKKLK